MKANGNLIVDLTFDFSLDILVFTDQLESLRKYTVAKQLCKSGTSIGANVIEAQSSESKADFIHKMKIAAKEAEETRYWLDLCKHSPLLPDPADELLKKIVSITKVLTAIIASAKKRL